MEIKQRVPGLKTIESVVENNTGMSIEEFIHPEKDYKINLLDEASDIIKDAVEKNIPITIVGDYDADGICASSIMYLGIKALGTENVKVRLPKRFSEGYGLSQKIIDEIEEGLLITVDNGIAAFDAVEKAKDKGLTVIVTDHHLAPEDGRIPNADIVIDPNAIAGSATFNGYCGAGIAYKLTEKLIPSNTKLLPKLKSFAAIATVTDVMKLVEENRLIVQEGLNNLVTYQGRTTGLGALLSACDMDKYISEKNIAFKVGPTINAAGRMYDDGANISLETLSFNSRVTDAIEKAENLIKINDARKALKEEKLEVVRANIKLNCLFGDYPMVVYEPDLPEGLIGIFAGKIAEEFKTPCIMLTSSTDSDEEILKGSARSYDGVNLKKLLDENSSLLCKYGGHAEAAGLSLKLKDLDEFRNAIVGSVERPNDDGIDTVYYDLEINANEVNTVLKDLEKYAPYGEGNPEIVYYVKNFMVTPGLGGFYRTMGENGQHIKLLAQDMVAVGFDMTEQYQLMGEPKTVNLVGMISKNYFMGKFTTQIEIIAMENAQTSIKKSPMASMLSKMSKERYA